MTALVLVLALGVGAGVSAPAATAKPNATCAVTLPNRTVPAGAGFSAAGFNYGDAKLRVHFTWRRSTLAAGVRPDGGAKATINTDGSIRAKVGWWRGVPGKLVIRGRRLDAAARPLRGDVPDGYGALGFQPTALLFPTVGCWEVVGTVARARLTFVVRVTKLRG